jgi:hypothetical protein
MAPTKEFYGNNMQPHFFNALHQRWNRFYEIEALTAVIEGYLFWGSTPCILVVSTNVREETPTPIFTVEDNIRIGMSLESYTSSLNK